jgi:hypothetical protein
MISTTSVIKFANDKLSEMFDVEFSLTDEPAGDLLNKRNFYNGGWKLKMIFLHLMNVGLFRYIQLR